MPRRFICPGRCKEFISRHDYIQRRHYCRRHMCNLSDNDQSSPLEPNASRDANYLTLLFNIEGAT